MTEKPQFSYKEMYITPFTKRRHCDEYGRTSYLPIERNLQPTGIRLLDGFAAQLMTGNSNRGSYCKRMGITTTQLSNLFLLLTGVTTDEFRNYFVLRMTDELLQYTDMEMSDIARRSGLGSTVNMFYTFRREYNCSPTERRRALRKQNDLGEFML